MGRTFKESLQKALRGLETGIDGLTPICDAAARRRRRAQCVCSKNCACRVPDRLRYVGDAFRAGCTMAEVHKASRIDPWFLVQIEDIVNEERAIARAASRRSTNPVCER